MQVAEMVCSCFTAVMVADDDDEAVVTATGTNMNVTSSTGLSERN